MRSPILAPAVAKIHHVIRADADLVRHSADAGSRIHTQPGGQGSVALTHGIGLVCIEQIDALGGGPADDPAPSAPVRAAGAVAHVDAPEVGSLRVLVNGNAFRQAEVHESVGVLADLERDAVAGFADDDRVVGVRAQDEALHAVR